MATVVEGNQKAPFSIGLLRSGVVVAVWILSVGKFGEGEGATPYPGLLHFTLDTNLILLSVKQGGIKYHF